SVRASRAPLRRPTEPATLALDRVAAWVDQGHATAVLRGAAPSSGGLLSLAAGRGRMQVDPAGGAQEAARDLYSMLTISAALLLARLERALVHAAAVVAPDGDAWLLVGDARSGKSTTCATLAAAGWGYVSDDQVVLAAREDGVEVEGWLRPFHLDRNGEGGEPTGERREGAPADLGLAGWRRRAPLARGVLPVAAGARRAARPAGTSAGRPVLGARAAAPRERGIHAGLHTVHPPAGDARGVPVVCVRRRIGMAGLRARRHRRRSVARTGGPAAAPGAGPGHGSGDGRYRGCLSRRSDRRAAARGGRSGAARGPAGGDRRAGAAG